jgi:hypothetical protein
MRIIGLLLALAISGCATISDKDLTNKLDGKSLSKIYDCAGVPDENHSIDNKTYITYKRDIVSTVGQLRVELK